MTLEIVISAFIIASPLWIIAFELKKMNEK